MRKETLVVPRSLARLCISTITDPLDEPILEHFAQFAFETLGDGLDDVKIAFTPAQKGDGRAITPENTKSFAHTRYSIARWRISSIAFFSLSKKSGMWPADFQ